MNMLAYAAQKDVSPEQLCGLCGIDLHALKKKGKASLSARQFNDLWLNAAHLSNDPLFGLHFGESLQLAALGIVGQLIQTCSTVGEALTHAAAATHLITNQFGMEVSTAARSFTVRFIPFKKDEGTQTLAFRQMMDVFMVFVLHELDGLVLEKIRPAGVSFPYKITDQAEYERVLRCGAIRTGGVYALEFDKKYWDEPILTADYELQGMLLKKVGTADNTLATGQNLQTRISNFLLANTYLGIPSLEELAANFNTSARSLQRKLQEEGVTYQQIVDTIRKSLALHYLQSGNYPLKEISYILGYNEISAFNRAFKRWTGTTPLNYQEN